MNVRAWNVRRGWILLLAMGLGTGGAGRIAGAVTTANWRVAGREAFTAAEQESLAVDSEGGVRLAPAFDEIRGVDEGYVWSLLAVPGKGVRVGTGTRAALYSLANGADVARAVGRAVAVQINCMTVAPDGTLYLGTGPDGTIFRLAPNDSTPKVFCDLPERHVWNLVRESSGSLLAATGDRARLYRIDAQGNAKQLYAGSPDHFTSMARWQGKTLVGGDSDGVVYAVDDAGRASVLMDAAELEVKVLAVAPDGRLYAAVNPSPGDGLGAAGEPDDAGRRKGPKPTLYRILANGVVETVSSA
jgi:outer membrane protein assembly factor BamB